MTPELVALLHAAATLAMFGLIWFVQLVHYPLFGFAAAGDFAAFAHEHQRRTGWVVVPLMLAELLTAGALVAVPPAGTGRLLPLAGLALIAVIWISTAFVQVPCHARLAGGYDAATARRLVASNWIRTAAWSARAPLALLILYSGTGR